ncbi:POK9 protein, partial [Eulacestoma nigropectus]|nr:POK9 protein [Eulacestoma nigropectus]
IDPIRNEPDITVIDFIKTCAHIGREQHRADLLAKALAQQLQVTQATIKCFDCGEEGHVRKQCPKNEQKDKKPSRLCPRCKKGYHWSSQYCSKFNRNGRYLPKQGNSKRGTGSGAPQQNRIQPQLIPT